jgi:leucyl-tRNA synthetase
MRITQLLNWSAALKAEKAQPFLAGKTVKKIIVVPRKLVNIVVG